MIAYGRVENGVVVLEEGIHFPEGQKVTVLAPNDVPSYPQQKIAAPHSILDIPPVSLGPILCSLAEDDDLLDEMLAGRP